MIFDPEKTIEVTERQAKFPKNPSQFIDCFSDTKTVIQKYSIFDISAIIIINAISNFDENIKPSLCQQIVPKGIKFMEIATTRKIKGQLISKIDPIARLILQTAELMYKQINWANPPIITDFSCDCIKQICNDGEAVYEKKEKLSKELYVANELIKKKTEEIEQLVK
ncbi:MAG: hypothetical protein IJT36_06715 [Alphaproteobacteria bacterium]|nr:hypothetical protein [Alphaproteobacteria bacterium]